MGVIQPSLRDLCGLCPEPGSELPGYYQVSLREKPDGKCPTPVFAFGKRARKILFNMQESDG